MVPCVGNKPPISVKVERKKNSIMISLVLAKVPEKESRKHLRYVEEESENRGSPHKSPGLSHLHTRPGASEQ